MTGGKKKKLINTMRYHFVMLLAYFIVICVTCPTCVSYMVLLFPEKILGPGGGCCYMTGCFIFFKQLLLLTIKLVDAQEMFVLPRLYPCNCPLYYYCTYFIGLLANKWSAHSHDRHSLLRTLTNPRSNLVYT